MKPVYIGDTFTKLLKISTYGFNAASKGRGIVLLDTEQTKHVERVHDVEGQRTTLALPFENVEVAIQQLDPLLESLKQLKAEQLREAEEKGVPLKVHMET